MDRGASRRKEAKKLPEWVSAGEAEVLTPLRPSYSADAPHFLDVRMPAGVLVSSGWRNAMEAHPLFDFLSCHLSVQGRGNPSDCSAVGESMSRWSSFSFLLLLLLVQQAWSPSEDSYIFKRY